MTVAICNVFSLWQVLNQAVALKYLSHSIVWTPVVYSNDRLENQYLTNVGPNGLVVSL